MMLLVSESWLYWLKQFEGIAIGVKEVDHEAPLVGSGRNGDWLGLKADALGLQSSITGAQIGHGQAEMGIAGAIGLALCNFLFAIF